MSPPSESQIRILIADDHAVVRDGLRLLFGTQPDFTVVGEARDGSEALRLAMSLQPDVMLLDHSMPGISGTEVLRALRGSTTPRTIVFTASASTSDMLGFVRDGARGVVLKDAPTDLVFKSVRKVHEGELWVTKDVANLAFAAFQAMSTPGTAPAPTPQVDFGLTRREQQILTLVTQGETNKGIAVRLGITEDTVKHHLTSIFDKTGASNRLELALFALHHRLIES